MKLGFIEIVSKEEAAAFRQRKSLSRVTGRPVRFRDLVESQKEKVGMGRLFRYRNLKFELRRAGYELKFKTYLVTYLIALAGVIGCCMVFRMGFAYMLPVIAFYSLVFPHLFFLNRRNRYESLKFDTVTQYMEQFLYSFKRTPKVLVALEDTSMLFAGRNGNDEEFLALIKKAIRRIRRGVASQGRSIYEEAFNIIEESYGCKRLYKMHDFAIRVESMGGECNDSLDVLLEDRNYWIERIRNYKVSTDRLVKGIGLVILLSMVPANIMSYALPKEFQVRASMVSQIASVIVLLGLMLVWYLTQKKLSRSLLNLDGDVSERKVLEAYDLLEKAGLNKRKVFFGFAGGLIILLGGAWFLMGGKVPGGTLMAAGVYAMSMPVLRVKSAHKLLSREIEKSFPDWLMSMALQMQTNNVHVSIANMAAESPAVLRPEFEKLLKGVSQEPDSVEPYMAFCSRFHLPDIKAAMKMLYSMSVFGSETAGEQIRALVKRNVTMLDRAEKVRLEDADTMTNMIAMVPMVISSVKLVTDMALVLMGILSQVSRHMQF